jgi:sphinganine C4-monooxygenase
MNTTACQAGSIVCSHLENIPFYYSHKASLFASFPDQYLALASPIFAYWSLSLIFHGLDISGWKWLERYRIHESSEVKARNIATRSQVVWAVLLQQVIQTLLGLLWLSDGPKAVNHVQNMQGISTKLGPLFKWSMGVTKGEEVMDDWVYFVYWWGIPIFQFLTAMYVSSYGVYSACTMYSQSLSVRFFIDTWQYFLHRLMHTNKFLYRQFHSWHHRLYVPYAFGSLYNHPVEGFVLDTLGAALAEMLTGMSTRQATMLFTFSTLKTVDDHCGYNLPFDPLQLFGNNADYHDIHHQVWVSFCIS